jgi:selenocysteine lyase/cysteine desulfurase
MSYCEPFLRFYKYISDLVINKIRKFMSDLERYFGSFRENIIGSDADIETPYGRKRLVYADWIASGRLYGPIEKRLSEDIGPMVGNTHSESSSTGLAMTKAYHLSQKIVPCQCGRDDLSSGRMNC